MFARRFEFGLIALVTFGCSAASNARGQGLALPTEGVTFATASVASGDLTITRQIIVMEQRTRTYTVSVPYTEEVNGVPETKMRMETREQTYNVHVPVTETMMAPLEQCKFSSASGQRLPDTQKVARYLNTERPILISSTPEPLSAYFQQVLKPNVLVVYMEPQDTPLAPPAPEPADDLFGTPPSPEPVDDLFGG